VSGFASDRSSGSAGVAARFLDELERWVRLDRSPDPPTLRAALFLRLREAQANQPSMALVHQFAARALSKPRKTWTASRSGIAVATSAMYL